MNRLMMCLLVVAGFGVVLASDDIPPPRPVDVAALVRQLGSEDAAERETAAKRLSGLAIDPPASLVAATKSGDMALRERALKVAQVMRWNVTATRLPRGERFAERGKVDLFVAATAVWKLKPDDSRLWEPAQDLGRRLIEKAGMPAKPHNCPSSFKDLATYKRLNGPQFTRVDELYVRPDPHPTLYINEAIQAAGVYGSTGICNNLIVSRGKVDTDSAIQASVVFANGDVTARNGLYDVVIVCDGDVSLTDSQISVGLIVARGNITSKFGADRAILIAGGTVTLGKPRKGVAEGRRNTIKEHQTNPLGYITFFELSRVGVEVQVADKVVSVAKLAEGKPFAVAGVKVGDVVVEVDGKEPDSAESLRRLLRDALAIGDATVKVRRGEKTETVKVSLPE